MSHKMKTVPNNEYKCEKYFNRMLRQEKASTKKSPPAPPYQEKISSLLKQSLTINNQRIKPKLNSKQQSPVPKTTPAIISNTTRDLSPPHREINKEKMNTQKTRTRSTSRNRSISKDREPWSQTLLHKFKDRTSSTFSNFDPLRTVHFLSKELQFKLENLLPEDDGTIQMVVDIQHALKRIPPEIATLLHSYSSDFPIPLKTSESIETYFTKSPTLSKWCQTPPTLYQEDTEKFQKIMEDNTYRLEASCKQLENVCTSLQNEKEMTERELEEARETVELLCKRVKELELEIEDISNMKISRLEEDKKELQEQLDKAMNEIKNNPSISSLRKHLDELKRQKAISEENSARLEYDLTLLRMEKEKLATMLTLRDHEIKEIQEEMGKIQEQVKIQLNKLNTEVLAKVKIVKSNSDPFLAANQENKGGFMDFGDATLSSINTNESERDVMREFPCGDGAMFEMKQNQHDHLMQRLLQIKSSNVEIDLPTTKDHDSILEEILREMTPSCKALLNSAS